MAKTPNTTPQGPTSDPIVAGLGAPLADAVVLRGYLSVPPDGAADLILFPTAAFDRHLAIPRADVLRLHRLPEERGTVLWVKATAAIQEVRATTAAAAEARYLSGDLCADPTTTTTGCCCCCGGGGTRGGGTGGVLVEDYCSPAQKRNSAPGCC